jgi:PKD repeat protein
MKKFLLPLSALTLLIITALFYYNLNLSENELIYSEFIEKHEFNNRAAMSKKELKKIPKKDRPDLANEREFLLTMDPSIQRPAPERLVPVISYVNEKRAQLINKSLPGSAGYEWVERGPNNVGGRTRAIMFDPNDGTNKKVWAGGVGGGLWYNNDITNASSQWQAVDDFWANIAITCIAYDPTDTDVFYVGTGEGWYNVDAQYGGGVWKTTDAGATWSVLSATATSTYRYIQKILVHPTTGDVYVGTNNGIRRSTDGGSSFSSVLSGFISDLEIGADNNLYAAKGNVFTAGNIYSSTTGNSGTWSSINGNGFPTSGIGRVEISTAPSDANVLYALTQDASTNDVGGIYRSDDQGASWSSVTMPTWDGEGNFARGQAWYDLISGVDPSNANTIYVGGVDLFKSTNGGSSWTQLSYWYLDPSNVNYAHADQHAIVFRPSNPNFVVHGNDGGVSITTDGGQNFETRVNGYNVTQFYSCAINPDANSPIIIGGAQDNGSHYIDAAGIQPSIEVLGGDGAFAFCDQEVEDIYIVSSQNGNFYKYQNGSYAGQILSGSQGEFISPSDYDDRENILYTALKNSNSAIIRVTNIDGTPSEESLSTSLNAEATHFRVSPYAPVGTTNLFVGTAGGGVYKITNAHNGSASTSNINLPGSGSVSCIEIGVSESELLVTKSNYGITSVYYSSTGGSSWVSKEGDLPDMPVRWALFNPNNRLEVILATEVGIWGTNDISVGSPDWEPHVLGMANVRVDMLQVRDSDKEVVAGTHGRGFFTSSGFNSSAQPSLVADFSANTTSINAGETVTFTDESTGSPETWAWIFTGGAVPTFNGQSPTAITYATVGCYEVELTVTRNSGADTDTETKTCYINVAAPESCQNLMTYDVDNNPVVNSTDAAAFGIQFIDEDQKTPNANLTDQGWTSEWVTVDISGNDALGAVSWFDPIGQASNWIIFGPLTLPDLSASVSWKHVIPNNDFRDGYEVIVTTTGSAISNFSDPQATVIASFEDNDVNTDGDQSMTLQTADIPNAYLEGQVYIAFHHTAYDMLAIYLDDFVVEGCSNLEAPVADFTADVTTISPGGTVDFTDLSTNSPNTWVWNFDGGTGSTNIENPQNVVFNTPGCYEISLTAANVIGSDSETKTCYIEVIALPTADFTANNVTIIQGGTVDFTDLSTGNPDDWNWRLTGSVQGSASAQNPINIQYNAVGCYEVKLQVFKQGVEGNQEIKSCYINVIEAPNTDFEADVTTIATGGTVDFTDLSTGDGDSWTWTFSGSNQGSSNIQNPTGITYDSPGTFAVTLTVDASGVASDSETKAAYIRVIELPVANFEASDTTIDINSSINFTDLSTGNADGWFWTFEGTTVGSSIQQNPSNITYNQEGCFDVELQVYKSGLEGPSKTKWCHITVVDRTGVKESLLGALSIYPNPINDKIRFKGVNESFTYQLISTQGQLVKNGVVNSEQDVINVGALTNGNYYLRVNYEGGEFIKNLIIVR